MANSKEPGGSGSFSDKDEIWETIALWGDAGGLDLAPKEPEPAELSLIERLIEDRPKVDPAAAMADIARNLAFEEHFPGLVITDDPIKLIRRLPDGRLEKYLEKHFTERRKGKQESASYGVGRLAERKVSAFLMNWEFMRGSLGVVAGEKFQRAADIAVKEELPLIGFFASGGARQQENKAGLVQMERMVEAIRKFRDSTDLPYISVLVGEVWGGISASAVPLGDVTVALAGSNYGFSGPRVIETYQQGVPVTPGAQTVENNLLHRNIDLIVQDTDELTEYLKDFLSVSKRPKKPQLTEENIPELRLIGRPGQKRLLTIGRAGIAAALYERQEAAQEFEVPDQAPSDPESPEDERLMATYGSFIRSPSRIDSEFVMQHVFGDVVPLYNHYVDSEKKIYPPIIAAIGRIGLQPFLVIGHQPSYNFAGGWVRRIPATPAPKDFEYDRRMLTLGNRLRLPLVRLVDTLGAEPTTAAEEHGQSRSIAMTLYQNNAYEQPTYSVVLNALGSGGGLAAAPRGEYRAMLESAMAYVAEPSSASAILYKIAQPDREITQFTLANMSATAQDQLRNKLIDEVIPEGNTPYETIKHIHQALATAYARTAEKHFRRRRRSARVRNMRAFKIR